MELTNFANFRNDFVSDLEAVSGLSLATAPVNYNMNLQFKTIRDFFSYLSGIHIMEPVLGDINLFIKPSEITGTPINYEQFIATTVIDSQMTFRFVPLTKLAEYAISFNNDGLFGQRSTYKPLGDASTEILDSRMTMTLTEAVTFFNSHFKNKFFKGSVTFSNTSFYKKGTILYISDRAFYIIITSYKNEKNGIYSYSGVVSLKG